MPKSASTQIAVIGIDIGKNSFHVVGHDKRGSIVLRQKWSRGQIEARLASLPPCLVGMEAGVGAHPLARKLPAYGHEPWIFPLPLKAVLLGWQGGMPASGHGETNHHRDWHRRTTPALPPATDQGRSFLGEWRFV